MQSEKLKALASFGGYWVPAYDAPKYFVSIDGRIVSFLNHIKVLKPQMHGTYLGINIASANGTRKTRYIHRLMLESWDRPASLKEQCRHLDGNKFNNRLDNLVWGSAKENAKDKELHGTVPFGEKNPMAVLTKDMVLRMRDIRLFSQKSYKEIGQYFNVSTMTAFRAITGQSWSNL